MGAKPDDIKGVAKAPTDAVTSDCGEAGTVLEHGDGTTAALIERAAPEVRRWARGRLPQYARDDANTEDVVQDAVMRTLKHIPRFQQRTAAGIQAYLRVGVVNRIRDLIRRVKRRGVAVELSDDVPDDQPSPLEAAIKGEQLDRFLAALQQLSPSDRQVIVWRIKLGYSLAEIAARLGKSKPAAGMSLTRAIDRLARHLGLHDRAECTRVASGDHETSADQLVGKNPEPKRQKTSFSTS